MFFHHFENDSTAGRRKQVTLDHDLALIKPIPGGSENMPFLVCRDLKGNPTEMVWMEPDNNEFINEPIYLLGYTTEQKSDLSTPETEGALLFRPNDGTAQATT